MDMLQMDIFRMGTITEVDLVQRVLSSHGFAE